MLLDPRENVRQVEESAICGANWVFERLEGEGAEVVWQTSESMSTILSLLHVGSGARGEGILGRPLAVRDLEDIGQNG